MEKGPGVRREVSRFFKEKFINSLEFRPILNGVTLYLYVGRGC